MKKRLLSILLSVCMALSLLPVGAVTALAAEGDGGLTVETITLQYWTGNPASTSTGTWIFANGTPITIKAKGSGSVITDANGNEMVPAGFTNDPTNGYDLSAVGIVGGSHGGCTGDSSVTMTGGTVGCIIGGCYGGTLTGNASVTVNGGKLNGMTLGIYGSVCGDDAFHYLANKVSLVGGSFAGNKSVSEPPASAAVTGNVNVAITGGQLYGIQSAIGQGVQYGSRNYVKATANMVFLTVTGGTFTPAGVYGGFVNNRCFADVYGGETYGQATKGLFASITGNITVETNEVNAVMKGQQQFDFNSPGNAYILTDKQNEGKYRSSLANSHYIMVDDTAKTYTMSNGAQIFTNYTVPAGYTLEIPAGTTLTVPAGVTVTNNGSIVIKGTLTNNGTISGGSIVKVGAGTYTGGNPATADVKSTVEPFSGLTVAAGSARGTTKISAIDDKTAETNKQYYRYVYNTASEPVPPTADSKLSAEDNYAELTALNSDIPAAVGGGYLLVCEADSSGKLVKYHCTAMTSENVQGITAYDELADTIVAPGDGNNTTKVTVTAVEGDTFYYKLGSAAEGTGYAYNTPIDISGLPAVSSGADIPAAAGQYLSVYRVNSAAAADGKHLLHGFVCVQLTPAHYTAVTGGLVADTANKIIYCNGATVCMSADFADNRHDYITMPMLYVKVGDAWTAVVPKGLDFSSGQSYAGYTLSSKSGPSDSADRRGTLYLISSYAKYETEDYTSVRIFRCFPAADESWDTAIYPVGCVSGSSARPDVNTCCDYRVINTVDPSASRLDYLGADVKSMTVTSLSVDAGGKFIVPSVKDGNAIRPADKFKVIYTGNRSDIVSGTVDNIWNMSFTPKVDIRLYRADNTEFGKDSSGKYQIPNNVPVTIVAAFGASPTKASVTSIPPTAAVPSETSDISEAPMLDVYAIGFYSFAGESKYKYYPKNQLAISTAGSEENKVTTVAVTVPNFSAYKPYTYQNDSKETETTSWEIFADISGVTDGGSGSDAIPPRLTDSRTYCSFTILKSAQTPLTVSGAPANPTYGDQDFKLSVTGGSGSGALSFTSSNTDVATVDANGTVHILKAGSTNITITKAGDGDYESASKTFTLNVAKKAPTTADLTMTPPADLVYSGSEKAATVAANGGLTGFGTVSAPYYKDANGSTVTPINAGTYTVFVDIAAGDNYAAATGLSVGTFEITKNQSIGAPTITAIDDNANTLTFTPVAGVSSYEYSADAGTSWLPCNITSRSDSAVTISVGNIAGTVQVRAKASDNYDAGAYATSSTAFTATLEGGVSISGTAKYGQTLTATVSGAQKNADLKYQWQRGGTNIAGATAGTYLLAGEDIGAAITVTVSAKDYSGTLTSAATAAVAKGTPSGAPAYTAITTSGKTLADAALKIGTLIPNTEGYSLKWVNDKNEELPDTTSVAANTSYKWLFTPKDTANYDALSGSVTLYAVSSSGGGGGGSSTTTPTTNTDSKTTTNTDSKTTTNTDGSTTKTDTTTKTDSTGATTTTEVKTTTNADGTTTKTEVATVKKTDAATGAVTETTTQKTTDAAGKTETVEQAKTTVTDKTTGAVSEKVTQKTTDAAGKTETVEQAKTTVTDKTTGAKTEIVAEAKTTADGTTTKVETVKVAGGTDGVTAEAKVETAKTGEAVATATVEAPADAKAATLPAAVVEAVTKADTANVTVKVGEVSVALDKTAVEAVKATGGEAPVISATPVAAKELPAELQSATTAYDFKVSGKGVNFGGGSAVVSVPYTKTDSSKAVAVYHIDAAGNKTRVYDAKLAAGTLNIPTVGWSTYAVLEVAPLPFTDVKDTDWFYGSVQYAVDNSLFNGTSATTFAPNDTMTRAMLVTVLWRMAGSPVVNYAMSFSDVPEGEWYAEAVRWAASEKLVTGYENGCFGANDAVTREQMVSILYRYAALKKYSVSGASELTAFSDAANVSSYALPAVKWAVGAKLLTGSDGKLNPADGATRAEVAAILMRFGQKLAK